MTEDKAKELGRIIGQSTEYQAVKRANDALGEDRDAVVLLRRMEELRMEAQRLIERGERPTEQMERDLDDLLTKVQTNPTYQRLVSAQENYDKLMMKVNDWIVDQLDHHTRLTHHGAVARERVAGEAARRGGRGGGRKVDPRAPHRRRVGAGWTIAPRVS